MNKSTAGIMTLATYAIVALMVSVVAANGPAVLLPVASVIVAVYAGCLIHVLVIYSSCLNAFAKVSPSKFFKAMINPMVFAFTTASSASTLPLNLEATDKLGVPVGVRSFVLPLGATIYMDGTAIYKGICALFIANVYGLNFYLARQATILLRAHLSSIGTAGFPGGGMVMLGIVLQSVGLPIEGVALIAGVDRILDMGRTCVNITGDATCAVVIAASEKELESNTVNGLVR